LTCTETHDIKNLTNEEKMKKKNWKTPKMTVLLRARPEEAVLTSCKTGGDLNIAHPNIDSQGCGLGTTNCAACQSRGASGS
jgi:hypothetical protein